MDQDVNRTAQRSRLHRRKRYTAMACLSLSIVLAAGASGALATGMLKAESENSSAADTSSFGSTANSDSDSVQALTNATTSDAVGSSFTVDGIGYTVLTAASSSSSGTVRLTQVNNNLDNASIPNTVTSPSSELNYTVTSVTFQAFSKHKNLKSITLPGSIEGCIPATIPADACFYGCSSLKSISVNDVTESSFLASEDGVLYAQYGGKKATLLAYPQAKNNSSFSLPESVSGIYPYAFEGNTSLASVAFTGSLTGISGTNSIYFSGGIGAHAFDGCAALSEVDFADGMQIATASTSSAAAIGANAFKGCIALTNISIPALASADVKGDSYRSFSELNPNSNLTVNNDSAFISGYMPYWHNDAGPVARSGIGAEAFMGCTALESISFQAGNSNGAYAYWTADSNVFKNCTSLKTLVYQSTQAYWGNANRSMRNGSFTDIWDSDAEAGENKGHNAIDDPTYYYAVDYYATQADANAADANGSTRLARVEYKRGTSTSDIATSSSSLGAQTCDRDLYAQTDADGVIPDPDEAAAAAGFEGTGWVWHLDNTQSRRSGLSESCRAYLVKANELSGARLSSTKIENEYKLADQNLSQGTDLCAESAFDVKRYYTDSYYQMEGSTNTACAFTFDPDTGKLDDMFAFVASDGSTVSLDTCNVRYQRYNTGTGALEDAVSTITAGGVYLVTIEADTSGYNGSFSEWIVVKGRSGDVKEVYGDSVAITEHGAKYALSSNETQSIDYSDSPYSITVGAKDADGALIASSYAGLVNGAINVDTDSSSVSYGFKLNRDFYSNGTANPGATGNKKPVTFARNGISASAFAVALYKHFADDANRSRYGLDAVDDEGSAKYTWGDTAILVPYGRADDVAAISAYAYAKKAPIFFTEEDGSVSSDTLAALKDFKTVRVTGPEILYSTANFNTLAGQLGEGTTLSRIGGSTANSGDFSLVVADELVSDGLANWSIVTVSGGDDPLDCILALNLSGHEGGVTLVSKSTEQTLTIASRLQAQGTNVHRVRLFGRSNNNATDVVSSEYESGESNIFNAVWSSAAKFSSIKAAVKTTKTDPGFQSLADKNASKKKSSTKKSSKKKSSKKKSTASKTKSSTQKAASSGSDSNRSSSSSDDDDGSASVAAATDDDNSGSSSDATATQTGYSVEDIGTDQQNETTATTEPAAPWVQFLFIIALIALCGSIVPLMRRCR